MKVLDLGCGKGAVSITIAEELKCNCLGIDGIREFIEFARNLTVKKGIDKYCQFEIGDIRVLINEKGRFDVIILGSIGPVFGDYLSTFKAVENHLEDNGILIIDDGYCQEDQSDRYPGVYTKNDILQSMNKSKVLLIKEYIDTDTNLNEEYEVQKSNISKRCYELIDKNQDKKELFLGYIKKQDLEYDYLKNNYVCSTMVFRRK